MSCWFGCPLVFGGGSPDGMWCQCDSLGAGECFCHSVPYDATLQFDLGCGKWVQIVADWCMELVQF